MPTASGIPRTGSGESSSASEPPAGRIEPGEPALARKSEALKEMPPDWGRVSYPAVWFHKDTALVFYLNSAKPLAYRVNKLRIIPLDWFYGK